MDEITDEILSVSSELIKFRTTEDRFDEIRKCMGYIKDYFADSNVVIREHSFKEKPSLFICFNKRKRQDLILNGHIDVIEGTDSQFLAERKGNFLYGRGTSDMKIALATMIVLMKKLSNMKKIPKVGLMIVSDEELGGFHGTRMLLKAGYKSNFAITGETSKFNVETKHKGSLQVRIIAYGSHSHASRPWLGNNAIEKLIKQWAKLLEEIPRANNQKKWLPSINPTNFIAEGPYNVTPAKAEMVLDIRTTEEWTNRKILYTLKKLNIKYKRILDGNMLYNNRKNNHIKSLKKITQNVLGRKVKYIKSCGGSDTRFFTNHNIPAVNFGPIGRNHHKHNEYLEISSIEPYYKILEKFIKENFVK